MATDSSPAFELPEEDSERDDQPREACGVFAIYAPGDPVARLVFDGLHALQHRGQESAGLAVSDGSLITVVKDMGLVTDVFDEPTLRSLKGDVAIGHTRYSTTGRSTWENAQPIFRSSEDLDFAVAHNGNLTNTLALSKATGGTSTGVTNDSDLIAELLAQEIEQNNVNLEEGLTKILPMLEGAFSLVFMDATRIVGVRDPKGFRPLCLGRLDNGWVLASETSALDVVGAHFVREIEPGEMIAIDESGVCRTSRPFPEETVSPNLCIFEFVYMARPDSQLYGRQVHNARVRMGEMLALRAPVEADMVIGVPESGLPAAEGYAKASGIPYGHGLVKNRYIGRTFISPSQDARERGVRRKLNPIAENVKGKRIIAVEDSVVRGTTTRFMARMLKEAGATEVHLRVSLPLVKWPCFYGVDIGSRRELLAANLSVTEIRDLLGVDSISFLNLEDLRTAIDVGDAGFCDACMTNNYPTEVGAEVNKLMLENDQVVEVEKVCGTSVVTYPAEAVAPLTK